MGDKHPPALAPYEIETVDYRGRVFRDFYVSRDGSRGPGWYVFGRSTGPDSYNGALVMLCARPDVKPRRHPHYNIRVRRGWHTKREAAEVARLLNEHYGKA